MKRRTIFAVMIGSLGLGTGAYPATGYPVTFEFAGEITHVWDDDGLLGGAVTVGSPFSGLYTFESTTPDSDPHEPRRGLYEGSLLAVSGSTGGLSYLGPQGFQNLIEVTDPFDSYIVKTEVAFVDETLEFFLRLGDSTGTAFSSDFLPLSPPDLSDFDATRFAIFDESEAIPLSIQGAFTSFVPEPAAVVFVGIGLCLLSRRRLRRIQFIKGRRS